MATPTTIQSFIGNRAGQVGTTLAAWTCQVLDENGQVMYGGVSIQWSVPQSGASAIFQTTGNSAPFTTVTGDLAAGGLGNSGPMVLNSTPGSWLFTVTAVGFPSCTRTFNVVNQALPTPTTVTVTGGTQKAAVNTAYLPLSAQVLDQYGAAMPGVTVTFTMPAGFGSWAGGGSLVRNVVTSGSGIATSPIFTANSTAGNLIPAPTVAVGSVAGTPSVSFKNVDPAVVTAISTFSGNNQSAPINTLFASALVARAANELNNPVAGASILFTAPGSGASCTFPTTTFTAISNASGLATTPQPTANGTTGAYTVSATKAGAQTALFGLTNGAAVASPANALSMCEA